MTGVTCVERQLEGLGPDVIGTDRLGEVAQQGGVARALVGPVVLDCRRLPRRVGTLDD
jgi:hypothetical protein